MIRIYESIASVWDVTAQIEDFRAQLALLAVDEAKRKEEKEVRQQEIMRQAEQAFWRNRLKGIVALAVVAAGLVFILLLFIWIIPEANYKKAEDLHARGEYVDAAKMFTWLQEYKDSAEHSCITRYSYATLLMAEEHYMEAWDVFDYLADYEDSYAQLAECTVLPIRSGEVQPGNVVSFGSDYRLNEGWIFQDQQGAGTFAEQQAL